MSSAAAVNITQMEEAPEATWEKRFFAQHYAYRDFHTAVTGFDPTAAVATYIFGTAARAINARNWPNVGDFAYARTSYARYIRVHCTSDAWVVIHSLNPRWIHEFIRLVALRNSVPSALAQLAAIPIPFVITETPQYILANALMPFFPAYAFAITFYFDPLAGMVPGIMRIWIDGNATGGD